MSSPRAPRFRRSTRSVTGASSSACTPTSSARTVDTALRRAIGRVPPAFSALFEAELGNAAARLAEDAGGLVPAVALYHGLLEGVAFPAGQEELLERLGDPGLLPGVAEGVRRVQRDERWHVAFGARMLATRVRRSMPTTSSPKGGGRSMRGGPLVSREVGETTLAALRRRLRAAGMARAA